MRTSYHVDRVQLSASADARSGKPSAMTAVLAIPDAADEAARRAAARLIRIAGEALPPELAHLAEGSLAEALGKAVDYARHAISPTTEKIYGDDWAAFSTWCAGHRAPHLPAAPAIVAAYLAERAATLGRSGLRVALAAIAYQHRRAGHIWTSGDPIIASVMKGILREQRRPVRPAAALTSDEVRRLLATCDAAPKHLASLRDRALLLTGFAGGLRRSELVALDHDDFRIDREGMRLRIRHSKADQEGEGAEVGIARFARTCPVRAVEAWLRASRITYGPVFRRLTSSGTIEGRLTGNGVWKILRRRADQAGLVVPDGERLSPHGLRAGFITEAYLNGALDEQVMAHARQKDISTTRRYRNRAKTVAASPAKLLNL